MAAANTVPPRMNESRHTNHGNGNRQFLLHDNISRLILIAVVVVRAAANFLLIFYEVIRVGHTYLGKPQLKPFHLLGFNSPQLCCASL